jgi:hypothetical protein
VSTPPNTPTSATLHGVVTTIQSQPVVQASAQDEEVFISFRLELNTAANFSGTTYSQEFSGAYTPATQYALSANNLSPGVPNTHNVTYYLRVRASSDSGASWGPWSTDNWSYTYNNPPVVPEWMQTIDAEFAAGTLSDTALNGQDRVGLAANPGAPVVYTDDFERPNSTNLGPMWDEAT